VFAHLEDAIAAFAERCGGACGGATLPCLALAPHPPQRIPSPTPTATATLPAVAPANAAVLSPILAKAAPDDYFLAYFEDVKADKQAMLRARAGRHSAFRIFYFETNKRVYATA
jgi:hypothetical protein